MLYIHRLIHLLFWKYNKINLIFLFSIFIQSPTRDISPREQPLLTVTKRNPTNLTFNSHIEISEIFDDLNTSFKTPSHFDFSNKLDKSPRNETKQASTLKVKFLNSSLLSSSNQISSVTSNASTVASKNLYNFEIRNQKTNSEPKYYTASSIKQQQIASLANASPKMSTEQVFLPGLETREPTNHKMSTLNARMKSTTTNDAGLNYFAPLNATSSNLLIRPISINNKLNNVLNKKWLVSFFC